MIAIALSFSLVLSQWYTQLQKIEKKHDPFLEVTNRDFSLFLNSFPSFIPFAKHDTQTEETVSNSLLQIDIDNTFVNAPEEVLFLYHTWHRLLFLYAPLRIIRPTEFREFLTTVPQWDAIGWPEAPIAYKELLQSQKYLNMKDLQELPFTTFPLTVRQAFQGWKNAFKEALEIDSWNPLFSDVLSFLLNFPNFARNEWRNIDQVAGLHVAGLDYLSSILHKDFQPTDIVPSTQLSSFLKIALFNMHKAKEEYGGI